MTSVDEKTSKRNGFGLSRRPSNVCDLEESKRTSLNNSITKSALFQHLKDDEMSTVFEYLFACDATAGDVIIKQGDEGDNFYIIDEGTVDIFVSNTKVSVSGKEEASENLH